LASNSESINFHDEFDTGSGWCRLWPPKASHQGPAAAAAFGCRGPTAITGREKSLTRATPRGQGTPSIANHINLNPFITVTLGRFNINDYFICNKHCKLNNENQN